MADGEKRIIELEELTTLTDNDYIAVDNSASGGKTKKFKPKNLQDATNQVLEDVAYLTWENNHYYNRGDIVAYEDYLYVCKVDEATYGSFERSDWKKTFVERWGRDLFFDISSQEMTFSDSEYTLPYSKGDVVYRYYPHPSNDGFQMRFYVAKDDYPNGVTEYVASQWDEYYSLSEVIQALTQELANEKANAEGSYDKLTVGLSHNIIGDSYEVDTAPYLYRPSKDGSAVDLSLVGATVAWNQLVQNGNFASADGWSYGGGVSGVTVSNNKMTATVTKNTNADIRRSFSYQRTTHKYLIRVTAQATGDCVGNPLFARIFNSQWGDESNINLGSLTSSEQTFAKVYSETKTSNGGKLAFGINAYPSADISGTIIYSNINIIDLTQMFGSTIADYIYSLEQATSGSGIAWLKSYGFLTKDYYAYDSGSLQSVNVASRKIVGKNLFEPSNLINDRTVNPSGEIAGYGGRVSTPNTISVVPNTNVVLTYNKNISQSIVFICALYKDGTMVSRTSGNSTGTTINTGECNQLRVAFYVADGTNITKDNLFNIQLEIGSVASQYEPYTTKFFTLNTGELRGLFKLDGDNLVADGDVDNGSGTITRKKYQITVNGTESWSFYRSDGSTEINSFACQPFGTKTPIEAWGSATSGNALSPYASVNGNAVYNHNAIAFAIDGNGTLIISSTQTSVDAWKTYLESHPITIVYTLATPTTESATPFENPQLVFSGGTEEFIDGATRDVAIPVGQNSKYYLDIKGKVEQLYGIPEPPSTNGTYKLVCTVSSGVKTYSWVSN